LERLQTCILSEYYDNVRDALGWLNSETPLTHKAYVQAYKADEERQCATLH
jgi:hypothetical protein